MSPGVRHIPGHRQFSRRDYWDHEDTLSWDPVRTGYRYDSEPAAEDCGAGGGLLFGGKLLPDFLCNGLLHLRGSGVA